MIPTRRAAGEQAAGKDAVIDPAARAQRLAKSLHPEERLQHPGEQAVHAQPALGDD